jgi:hypothetical protein
MNKKIKIQKIFAIEIAMVGRRFVPAKLCLYMFYLEKSQSLKSIIYVTFFVKKMGPQKFKWLEIKFIKRRFIVMPLKVFNLSITINIIFLTKIVYIEMPFKQLR